MSLAAVREHEPQGETKQEEASTESKKDRDFSSDGSSALKPEDGEHKLSACSFRLRIAALGHVPTTTTGTHDWALSLHFFLRVITALSGAAVAAVEWSKYKDGRICADYSPESDRYYGCLSGPGHLVLLTITRVSAGAVLAALCIVFFTK
eukprot:7618-Heterococcus_DN1.PRE.4